MGDRWSRWLLPALLIALLVNALMFLFVPLLSLQAPPLPEMTDPVAVHLVRVREQETPRVEEPEPPRPVEEEEKPPPEPFRPSLVLPRFQYVELPRVPGDQGPGLMAGPEIDVGGFYDAEGLDHPPRPILKVPPVYPLGAKRRGIEGYVTVKFLVDEKGAVSRVSILEGVPEGLFEESVRKILPTWKFEPGRIGEDPVASWAVTTIKFELR